ncbi:hypothetical protein FQR65_LT10268 [Abscondita terminalis]|nr:hypothetical protein FQR65_LT10268 [Abscondita terminalis]
MRLFPKEVRSENIQNKKNLVSEEQPNNNRDFSVFSYILNMFGLQATTMRSRKNAKNAWRDQYNLPSQRETGSMAFTTVDQNRKVDMPRKKEESLYRSLIKYIEEYFNNSTLHGLHYVGDTSISFGERLFWLLAFLTAVSCAAYFIANIYTKYDVSPVIISLNPTPTPISELPFPAITICSMNQAKKQEAFAIIESGTEVENMLLDDYCNSNNSFTNLTVSSDEGTKWENVQNLFYA